MKQAPSERRGSAIRLVKLAAWSALMAPVGIVLHELGHYLTARALGFTAVLNAASVSGGAEFGRDPAWMVAAQASAGPLVTVAIILFALHRFRRRRDRLWALALAATAPLRFIVGGSYLLISIYLWWVGATGEPNFDEANAARALDIPVTPILAVQMLLLIALWAWLIRAIPRGRRIVSVIAILVGAFAGIGAWMSFGPALFTLI